MDKSRRTLQNVLSIMMVAFLLISTLSPMFSLAASPSGSEAADEASEPVEPTADFWTITDTRYINESHGVDSDIIVDGGELYLNNATVSLLIDGYNPYEVVVKNGGMLKMWNSTLKTDPQDSLRPFAKTKVTAENGSTVQMEHDSSFEFPGWVFVQNSNLTMKDSRFEKLSDRPDYDYLWNEGDDNDDEDDNDDCPLLFVNESSEVLLQRSNITDYYENEYFQDSGEMNWTTTDPITNVSGDETLDLQNWTLTNPMLDHDDIEDYPYLNPTPRLSALYLEFSYSTEENYTDGNGTLEYLSPSEGWKELKELPAGNDTIVRNIYESGLGEFYREGGEYMHDLRLRVENTGSPGTNETNISIDEGSLRLVSTYENDIYVENSDLDIIDSSLDIDFNAADIDPRSNEEMSTDNETWMPDARTKSDDDSSHSVIRSIDSSVRAYGVEATDTPSATGDPVIVTNEGNENNTWIYRWARLNLKNEQNKTLPGAKVEVIPDNGEPSINDKVENLNDPENSSNAFGWDYLNETGLGDYDAADDTYITGENGNVTMMVVSDRINHPEDWPNSKFMGNYKLNITYRDSTQDLDNQTYQQFRLSNFPNITRSANHPTVKTRMDVPLPDLSVGNGDLVFKANGEETDEVSQGTDVEMNLTVHNEGDWKAKDVNVTFYKNQVKDTNMLNTGSIAQIDAGTNETIDLTWTANEIGNITIIAVVDGNDKIVELNETNNQISKQINVNEKPDLYVDDIYISPGTEVSNGTDVTVSASVGNSGGTDVQEANVSFYYYNSSSMPNRELFASEHYYVASGDSFNTSTFQWDYPDIGKYNISVEIWPTDTTVVESTEVNNNMSETVNVTSSPDLEMRGDSLKVLSDDGTQISDLVLGEQVTLNLTVYNIGDITANDINISVYLDSTNGKIIGTYMLPELGPGENRSFNLSWTPEVTGDHTLVAKADAPENITELEERNNIDTYSVSIKEHPDLIVNDIIFDPLPPIMNGTDLNLSAFVENDGGMDVTDVKVSFRYSTPSMTTSNPIDDTTLNITAGEVNLTTPLNWDYPEKGEYEIIAEVDPDDQVTETNETNNTFSEIINIDSKPDLVPTDFTLWPTEIRDGKTLSVNSTVTNQGGTEAQDVWVRFYVDKGTPSEEIIGTESVGDLNSGETSSTVTVNWEADIDGDAVDQQRDITVSVNDPGFEGDEDNVDNNEQTDPVTIYEPAALSIDKDDISFSDNRLTQLNTTIQIEVEVHNTGGKPVTTDVTFFDGSTIPNNMINQTTINVDKLDNTNTSVSWTPTTIANHSNHDIHVVVDYQEEVFEEDKTDNEASVLKPIFSEDYRFDLIVDGTETREMTGETNHGGFVVVEDSGTLEISGSNPRAEFSMNMDSDYKFSIIVRDQGQLTLDHSLIDASYDFNIYVEDDAGLKLMDESRLYSMVGVVGRDNSNIDISDSIVEGDLDIRSGDFAAEESQFISPAMFLQPDTIECINVTFEDDLVDFRDTVGSLTNVETGQIELRGDSEIKIYRWTEITALSEGGTPVSGADIEAINRDDSSYSMTKTTDENGMARFRLITDILLPSGSRALSNYRFNGTYQEDTESYYSDDITTSLPLYPSDKHVIQRDIDFPNLKIPDLEVDSFSVNPSEVTEGEHVEMTAQITNIGGADAGGIGVHFFVLDGENRRELNTSTIYLDQGDTKTVTAVWTETELGPDADDEDKHQMRQIIVRVDPDVDPVSDVNPGNNEGSAEVLVKTPVNIEFEPGLTIFGHNQETPPENLTERDEISLEVGIINTGGTMAKDLTITYFLDGERFGENNGQLKIDSLTNRIYVHNGTLMTNGDGLNLTIRVETSNSNETILRNELNTTIDVAAMDLQITNVNFPTKTQEQGDSTAIRGEVIRTKDGKSISNIEVYLTLSKGGETWDDPTWSGETSDDGEFLISLTTPKEGGEYTVSLRPEYEDEEATQQEGQLSVEGGGEAGLPLWILIAVIVAIAGGSIGGVFGYLWYTGPAEWVECGNCGATIPADSKECPECGVEFETDTVKCSECGEWIPAEADECPHCGSSFITTGTEVEDYEDRMKKQYQEFVNEYREEAKEELGKDITEEEFMDWWEDQPSYITFDEWVEREEARRKEGGIECPECGALNSMDAGVCQKCGNPLIHLEEEEEKEKEEIEEEELDLKTIGEGEEEKEEEAEEISEEEKEEEAEEKKKVKKKVKKKPKKVKKKVKKEPKKVKKKVKKEPKEKDEDEEKKVKKKVKKKPKEEEEEEE